MERGFFTKQRSDAKIQSYNALGCMASFHQLRRYLSTHSRNQILTGDTGLSAALRRGLGISRKATTSRCSAADERRVEPPWKAISPTHIPVAFKSENVGDDIQSLIAMELWGIELFVDRDDPSSWPEEAVVPLVGWWGRATFPTPATVKLIGFHCAKEGVHQVEQNARWFREAIERQGFPAYCRDLFTRDLLLRSMNIPAELGGCVSLTLEREWEPGSNRLAIDAGKAPKGYLSLTNVNHGLRLMTPQARLDSAARRLEEIRTARAVVTSRLHVWLPSLVIGAPVRLQAERMGSTERLGGYNLRATSRADLFLGGERAFLFANE